MNSSRRLAVSLECFSEVAKGGMEAGGLTSRGSHDSTTQHAGKVFVWWKIGELQAASLQVSADAREAFRFPRLPINSANFPHAQPLLAEILSLGLCPSSRPAPYPALIGLCCIVILPLPAEECQPPPMNQQALKPPSKAAAPVAKSSTSALKRPHP